jgi:PAS domain-containing protein
VEKQLAESTCMMRTLVDRTPSAVMYETVDRRLEFVNDRFGHLFGIEASPAQLAGLDASLVVKHSARLFADPARFHDRVEDLIAGEESYYGELVEMLDGRLFIRDFVVVRSGPALCGFFWHYREVMTPFDE